MAPSAVGLHWSAASAPRFAVADRRAKDSRVDIMQELKGMRVPLKPRGQYFQLPLGGSRELGSHKGYGLGLMVETLCTMLSGMLPFGLERATGYKHCFAAYNIAPIVWAPRTTPHVPGQWQSPWLPAVHRGQCRPQAF